MANLSGPGITDEDPGTRTVGMVVEDENLKTKIQGNLYKLDDRYYGNGIGITSFNGVVLLTGTVPDERMVKQAGVVAKKMRAVRSVHNELVVGPAASTGQRLDDAWLETKINFVMGITRGFPSSRIVVVVDHGTLYLMGLVTQAEANETIDLIKDISGIRRVVKIFEIIAANGKPTAPPVDTGLPQEDNDSEFVTSPLSN